MNPENKRPAPQLSNIFTFLAKGYTLREILRRGLALKLYSLVSHLIIPFAQRGKGTQIAPSTIVDGARYISIGSDVWLQRSVWLSVPLLDMAKPEPRIYLTIEDGCRVGPHCTISAYNRIHLKKNILLAPNVMIVDHVHNYDDVTAPIHYQGLGQEGTVTIEENCWISTNVVIASPKGKDLVIGRNSIVGANAVIRTSIPPYSMVAGNPAAVVKEYNFDRKEWVSVKN